MSFALPTLFHPTLLAPDRTAVERWFNEVLQRPSVALEDLFATQAEEWEGYRLDYAVFTPVADVFIETLQPDRHIIRGVQQLPDVSQPQLAAMAWFVDGMTELYVDLRGRGYRCLGQAGTEGTVTEPPRGATGHIPLFFTDPAETGLAYEFFPAGPFPGDLRTEPGWTLASPAAGDPLGIERVACHTILTNDVERALALVVDSLGGTVVHEGRNETLGTDSTYVALASTVLEYALPVVDGATAMPGWSRNRQLDTYHAITWKVQDLDQVAAHLRSCGVGLSARSASMAVTDPKDSMGIPWGFSVKPMPGDPYAGGED